MTTLPVPLVITPPAPISASTKRQYQNCFNQLPKDLNVVKDAAKVINWVRTTRKGTGTQNTSICAYLRVIKGLLVKTDTEYTSDQLIEAYNLYTQELKRLRELKEPTVLVDGANPTAVPLKNEEVGWADILSFKDKARGLSPEEYLIYLLYTEIPPLRTDYINLFIYPTHRRTVHSNNYIISSKDPRRWKLVLNRYKSWDIYGTQIISLPLCIVTLIQENMTVLSGFWDPVHKYPFILKKTAAQLSEQVSAIFSKLGLTQTLSIKELRATYIKNFLSETRSQSEKEGLARQMLLSKPID